MDFSGELAILQVGVERICIEFARGVALQWFLWAGWCEGKCMRWSSLQRRRSEISVVHVRAV